MIMRVWMTASNTNLYSVAICQWHEKIDSIGMENIGGLANAYSSPVKYISSAESPGQILSANKGGSNPTVSSPQRNKTDIANMRALSASSHNASPSSNRTVSVAETVGVSSLGREPHAPQDMRTSSANLEDQMGVVAIIPADPLPKATGDVEYHSARQRLRSYVSQHTRFLRGDGEIQSVGYDAPCMDILQTRWATCNVTANFWSEMGLQCNDFIVASYKTGTLPITSNVRRKWRQYLGVSFTYAHYHTLPSFSCKTDRLTQLTSESNLMPIRMLSRVSFPLTMIFNGSLVTMLQRCIFKRMSW